jgi:aerotaxis receptor
VLKAGNLGTGIVKNKTVSGVFYWVKAMVFPCFKNGIIMGYLSVRVKPTEKEIKDAMEAYGKLPYFQVFYN